MFMLSTRHLLSFYVWLASIGVIIWSYICNEEYVKFVMDLKDTSLAYELLSFNFSAISRFIGNYLLQVNIYNFTSRICNLIVIPRRCFWPSFSVSQVQLQKPPDTSCPNVSWASFSSFQPLSALRRESVDSF